MYNYTRTETEEEHAERVGADETNIEERWCDTCRTWEPSTSLCEAAEAVKLAEAEAEAAGLRARVRAKVRTRKLVCSCGWTTCPLIGRYGLTFPTFDGEIKPIPSQHVRDMRALEIKAGGGL